MAGGRFGSAVVFPYTTSKVWENQCSAAAGITVTGATLTGETYCASITLSDQNICDTCCTLLGTTTYNYNDLVGVYYVCDAYQGTLCYSQNTCNRFRRLGYVDTSNVPTETAGVYSGYYAYYAPMPYLSTCTIPNTNACSDFNYNTYIPISTGQCLAYVNVQCLNTSGGCVPYACPLKNLIGSCNAVPCICCAFLETTGTVGITDINYPCINMWAVDYWGRYKGIYLVEGNFNINTRFHCDVVAKVTINCCDPGSKRCNRTICYTCSIMGCAVGWSCISCVYAGKYTCDDRWLAQRMALAGCQLFVYQSPINSGGDAFTGFQAVCLDDDNGVWEATCSHGSCRLMFKYCCDNTVGVRWVTYNHKTGKNTFMWYHENTPEWNGIYDISSSQLSAIQSSGYSSCSCFTYPETFTGGTYFTKIADVPAAWCCIGAYDLTTTTPVAISNSEFMVRVGHLDNGLTGCMTRYTTSDFITWSATNESYYGSCLSSNTAITGNTTHTYYNVNNFKNLDPAGTVESCTAGTNIERTGIVIGDGDAVYVTNHSGTPAAFSVWGYTE